MLESITAFDGIAAAVIIVSAIMAFARGFLREVATLGAFIAAIAAAYFANRLFARDLAGLLPANAPVWLPNAILLAAAFLIVYAIAAWLGHGISKGIQGADGIGMMDHIAGLIFGVVRGGLALVFFAFLLNIFLDEGRVPSFIQSSFTYPHLQEFADVLRVEAVEAGEEMQTTLPIDEETGQ